jgi:hypothetical protein
MSLDYDADGLDLEELVDDDRLTAPPPGTTPRFALPGTTVDRAAFGYLHANCGGCHNPRSRVFLETPLELRLDVTKLASVTTIPAHATTVNVPGTVGGFVDPIVAPGNPAGSVMIVRMNFPGPPSKMPTLGTETVDPRGQDILTAWINQPP